MDTLCFWQFISYWGGIVGGILAILGILYGGWRWMCRWLRPSRDNWFAEFRHNSSTINSLDLQQTLSKDKRRSWTSPEPQSEGDSYKIDLGRDRVIGGIEFAEHSLSNEFPYGWRLMFLNKYGLPIRRHIEHEGKRIDIRFHPVKIRAIEVIIRKPHINKDGIIYHWRIENVYLWEAKLFSHWVMRI